MKQIDDILEEIGDDLKEHLRVFPMFGSQWSADKTLSDTLDLMTIQDTPAVRRNLLIHLAGMAVKSIQLLDRGEQPETKKPRTLTEIADDVVLDMVTNPISYRFSTQCLHGAHVACDGCLCRCHEVL